MDEYWLVAPRNRSVTVMHRTGEAYDQGIAYVNGEIRSQVLPGLTLTVDELFAGL